MLALTSMIIEAGCQEGEKGVGATEGMGAATTSSTCSPLRGKLVREELGKERAQDGRGSAHGGKRAQDTQKRMHSVGEGAGAAGGNARWKEGTDYKGEVA